MFRIAVFTAGLIVFSADARASEIVTVTIPELLGVYPNVGEDRETIVNLSQDVSSIQSVKIRLTGSSIVGALQCWVEVAGRQVEHVYELPYSFRIFMDDSDEGYWAALGVTTDNGGAFEIDAIFVGVDSPTWDFLFDGVASICLEARPIVEERPGCSMLAYASATLTGVTVTVTGDFGVSTEATTWGAIKALYH